MHWAIDHVEPQNYVSVVLGGVFFIEEHPILVMEILASRFWKPGINLLLDCRDLDLSRVNTQHLRMMSNKYHQIAEQLGDGKFALLMKSAFHFGLGRQFQMIADGKIQNEIGVFNDEKKMFDWLFEEKPEYHLLR